MMSDDLIVRGLPLYCVYFLCNKLTNLVTWKYVVFIVLYTNYDRYIPLSSSMRELFALLMFCFNALHIL
jgi:hypothetical protein